jgi:toxin ParE1/3/4
MTLFHPEAEREYLAAIDYYLAVGNTIGTRFAHAAETAILRVARNPGRFRQVVPGVRLCRVQSFPYTVLYSESQRAVLAVKHDRRDPNYWRDRLS